MADAAGRMSLLADAATRGNAPFNVVELWQVFSAEPVATTAVVDSVFSSTMKGLSISGAKFFGLWIQLSGTGTNDVQIQILQSWNDTAANYAVPNTTGTVVSSHTGTSAGVYLITPTPMPYIRFRLTGSASNSADTTATMYFWVQT